jgi:predicted transcriptional regulator
MLQVTREQAKELRREGKSVRDIAKYLGVSTSSVSSWVRDVPLTEIQRAALKEKQMRAAAQALVGHNNREKYKKIREDFQQRGRERARNGSPLYLMGCMLYWAEGAKSRNMLYFVNSDPNMMKLFMRFLRKEMFIGDEDCSITIHCHSNDPAEQRRIGNYWLELLALPESRLRKIQVKQGSNTRRNMLENGVCGLRVSRSAVIQEIYGAIQEYAGFDNQTWLF